MFPAADFFLYCFISLATPGPNTMMSLENGRRKGLRGIWLNLGMMCGQAVVILLCLAFSKTLFDRFPLFQPVMKLVGTIYMLYQAWKCLGRRGVDGRDPGKGDFLKGVTMQFINPKFLIVATSIISNYLLPYFPGTPALVGMALLVAVQAFVYAVAWLLCGAALSRFFARHETGANRVMALLLVYCAWKIAR